MAAHRKRRQRLRKGDKRLAVAGVTALAILITIYALAG